MPGKHYPKMDHGPKKYPQSNKFIGERKKAIDAGKKTFNVNGKTFPVTGGGPKMVGSKEKYTPGNFAEMHHAKMYNSPMYYPKALSDLKSADYRDTGKAADAFKKATDKAVDDVKNTSTTAKKEDRLSAARSRRKEARKNLKADRINRRAKRMEDRRR